MKVTGNILEDLISAVPTEQLNAAWTSVDRQLRYIIEERIAGRTLQHLGDEFQITRERIRQLQRKGIRVFLYAVERNWAGWSQWSIDVCNSLQLINIEMFTEQFSDKSSASVFIPVVFDSLGWKPQTKNSCWWLRDKLSVQREIESLVFDEPVRIKEWEIYKAESKLPQEYITYLLQNGILKLCEYEGYMIRSQHSRLDKAHAFLLEHGPSRVEEIARAVGEKNSHNFQEFLRRNDKFEKNFREKKWGLSEDIEIKFRTATEALLHLLATRGAMSKQEIHKAMSELYPVSVSRIQQCLTDYRIGTMADGKYNLIERGARKEPEAEPRRPSHMNCAGSIIGIRKNLDKNIMRGSGIVDHKWLAWKLDLNSTPMERVFSGLKGLQDLTVRRAGDNCQLSSLRGIVTEIGLLEGCSVVILLDIERFEWNLKHVCKACKASGVLTL